MTIKICHKDQTTFFIFMAYSLPPEILVCSNRKCKFQFFNHEVPRIRVKLILSRNLEMKGFIVSQVQDITPKLIR